MHKNNRGIYQFLLNISEKAKRYLTRIVGRFHARWEYSKVSDVEFLKALDDHFFSIQSYREYLEIRENPHFFIDYRHRDALLRVLKTLYPATEPFILSAADSACEHVFDLLGSGPVYLGDRNDWHIDFKTGHPFDPRRYHADIRPAPYPGGYDIKVPWELSRCQHFTRLGQAYWITSDEKYACEFVAQVEDWIENNPWPWGVNWNCTMEVAIREVNWLWGYYFFNGSPSLTGEFQLTFFKSLLIHGRHIYRNLENKGSFTGNHYLSNLVGLIYLGILCPEFEEANEWLEFGLRELEQEMFKQVNQDGVNFEASTSYHRLVLEMFLSTTILCRRNGHSFSLAYMERLEKMIDFIMYLTKPDGTVPLIGDNDNGRLHRLRVWDPPEHEWIDFRYLLAIGAVLFKRDDLARAAGDQLEETLWLLGEEAKSYWNRRLVNEEDHTDGDALHSQLFRDGGFCILRSPAFHITVSLTASTEDGKRKPKSHAHNDLLSFELFLNGQTWMVDPGMYCYSGDWVNRVRYRGTAYHNTIQVNGGEIRQIDRDRLFDLPGDVSLTINHWQTTKTMDLLDAQYVGYSHLSPSICHRRLFGLMKRQEVFILWDSVSTRSGHEFTTRFHLASECVVDSSSFLDGAPPRIFSIMQQESSLKIACFGVQDIELIPGEIAPGYGLKKSTTVLQFQHGQAPYALYVFYSPRVSHSLITAILARLAELFSSGTIVNHQGFENFLCSFGAEG